jgi:hypothetical protein
LKISSGLSFIDQGASPIRWIVPIAFQTIPLLFLFDIVWRFPESPRWLVKFRREDEARFILGKLRGTEGADKVSAEGEFPDILSVSQFEKACRKSNNLLVYVYGSGFRRSTH